jgi:hypothetical protein
MILEQLVSIGSLDDEDHIILSLMHSKTNNFEDFFINLEKANKIDPINFNYRPSS